MNTYYLVYQVEPSSENVQASEIARARAHVWALDTSPEEAIALAKEYLSVYNWKILSLDEGPIETTAEHFAHSEIGSKCFRRAQQDRVYGTFVAAREDGKPEDPVILIRLKP